MCSNIAIGGITVKPILALIAAFFLIASVPFSSQSKPQKARTGSSKKKMRPAPKSKPAASSLSPVNITPSGLIYVITRRGVGRLPKAGEIVSVHYTGVLTNGVKFDSSLDRGAPFDFELGSGRVIAGWDEALAKLHIGDHATLIIPPALGYGAKGTGPIPPNATLIFIIEFVGIRERPATK